MILSGVVDIEIVSCFSVCIKKFSKILIFTGL